MKRNLLMVLVFLGAHTALACSCAGGLPIEKYCSFTDAIFSGTVVYSKFVDPDPTAMNQDEYYETVFDVSEWYKAKGGHLVIVRSSAWGNLCGLTFAMGEQYLVWSYRRGGPGGEVEFSLQSNSCSRTKLLSQATDDVQWLVAHPGEC